LYWGSESIEIPNKNPNDAPIIWKTDILKKPGIPHIVPAVALYFEGSSPRIVTRSQPFLDGEYGCSYANGIRLFKWDKNKGWEYDPYTRIHTTYVGPVNLYSASPRMEPHLKEQIASHAGTLNPVSLDETATRQIIDTQHENPRCDYPASALSLAQVLQGSP
jgi:hypothetical protein